MYDIEQLRRVEFPHQDEVIYFNHASISPPPLRTARKMAWSAEQMTYHPMRHFIQDAMPMLADLKSKVLTLINAQDPSEIVPITSTGSGINAIAQALPIQAGENIVFCEQEFPTNAYPWMSLERDGVEIRKVEAVNGGLTLEKLEPLVDEKTKLVAASAVQFFSGHRTDLAAIGEFCHEKGIWFSVDAIQCMGHIPIDVQAMHIDILASGGQKSLMTAPGVGLMYVRAEIAEQMKPRIIGANATQDWLFWLDYDMTPLPAAERFSGGSPNVIGLFGLNESLEMLLELGIEHIDQHTQALAQNIMDVFENLGYAVITPRDAHAGIVTVKTGLDNDASDALIKWLDEQNVAVVKHLSPDGVPHLRASFHCYNTEEEIESFKAIIEDYQT